MNGTELFQEKTEYNQVLIGFNIPALPFSSYCLSTIFLSLLDSTFSHLYYVDSNNTFNCDLGLTKLMLVTKNLVCIRSRNKCLKYFMDFPRQVTPTIPVISNNNTDTNKITSVFKF